MFMGRNKTEYHENPEVAVVKDHLGMWPVDMEIAFNTHRQGKYGYHGPITLNGKITHIFYPTTEYE